MHMNTSVNLHLIIIIRIVELFSMLISLQLVIIIIVIIIIMIIILHTYIIIMIHCCCLSAYCECNDCYFNQILSMHAMRMETFTIRAASNPGYSD